MSSEVSESLDFRTAAREFNLSYCSESDTEADKYELKRKSINKKNFLKKKSKGSKRSNDLLEYAKKETLLADEDSDLKILAEKLRTYSERPTHPAISRSSTGTGVSRSNASSKNSSEDKSSEDIPIKNSKAESNDSNSSAKAGFCQGCVIH